MPLCHVLCLDLCFYMLRSTCLRSHAMFPWFCSSLCFVLMLELYAHMLDIMSMVMLCTDLFVCMLFPCFMFRSAFVHAYMLGSTFFHIYVLSFCMLTHVLHMPIPGFMFMCFDLCFHMFACLDLGFHMLVCLDLCFACFMPSSMCLCPLCHVCVPRPRLCLSCHVLL